MIHTEPGAIVEEAPVLACVGAKDATGAAASYAAQDPSSSGSRGLLSTALMMAWRSLSDVRTVSGATLIDQ